MKSSKKTILAVDDEQGYLDLYAYLISPMGIELTCVMNGKEAVEKVKEKAYDLVMMDVHMPEMTGSEAFKIIKQIRPEQKIVIFSSLSDPDHLFETEALKKGAVACIYKPMDIEEIQSVLKKVLF